MAKRRKYSKIQLQTNIRPEKLEPGAAPIIISQTVRGGLDVGDYMAALKSAESVDLPNRSKLLDIYDEVLTDAHLSAVIQKRKAAILNSQIEFTRNGVPDEKIGEQIRSPWFQRLLNDILDIEQFGNTLLQFRREGQWLDYDMIPRKHYCPIRRIIIQRQTDITGESFDNFSDLVLLGEARDLGLLAKAALYVIYKRNALSDFAQFVELYGHPLKEGTYNAYDAEVRKKLTNDLYESGGSSVVVHPEGTNLTIHDTNNKNATGQLYEGFMQFCNDELSKLELGNTLTTEVGEKGTQALGTVHQAGEDKITHLIKLLVLNILNYELTDVFTNLGFNTTNGDFSFSTPQTKDLSARIQIDLQLQAMGLKIPETYLYETYGIPKPEDGEIVANKKDSDPADPQKQPEIKPDPVEEKNNKSPQQKIDEKKERSFKNWVSGIFVRKPKPAAFRGKMNALYRGAAKEVESSFVFDAQALKAALIRIYEKDFNPVTEIELNLFNAIWDSLNIATEEGFTAVMVDRELEFLTQLKQNNAVFAAFKTHRMQNEIAAELLDKGGILKTFAQFKKDTESLVDHHVDAWLRTEYDTAVIRAHQAADWKQFEQEADILPNLEWRESLSVTPGADHRIFWGLILPINHWFWNEHRPGDRWNCKCPLRSTDKERTPEDAIPTTPGENKPAPGLGGNPAQTGQLFSDDHPYFTDTHKGADKAVADLLTSLSKAK